MTGSLQLRDYPADMVHLACTKCGRVGQHRKATPIKIYGPEMPLPDLLHEIAKCEKRGHMSDLCYAHYVDLMPK